MTTMTSTFIADPILDNLDVFDEKGTPYAQALLQLKFLRDSIKSETGTPNKLDGVARLLADNPGPYTFDGRDK